jgi:Fur family transcriptional regulator, iron response regulator
MPRQARTQDPHLDSLLRKAGLRPTRQRLTLARLLFADEHRHVTPEMLFNEAKQLGADLSLATVYNSLHQFREAGLVREVTLGSGRLWFDTHVGPHHHFFIEDSGVLIDIPDASVDVSTPPPPRGFAVDVVDVVVRLKPRN